MADSYKVTWAELFSGLRFHPATLLQSDLSCFAQFFTKWNNFDVDGLFDRICVFVRTKKNSRVALMLGSSRLGFCRFHLLMRIGLWFPFWISVSFFFSTSPLIGDTNQDTVVVDENGIILM